MHFENRNQNNNLNESGLGDVMLVLEKLIKSVYLYILLNNMSV